MADRQSTKEEGQRDIEADNSISQEPSLLSAGIVVGHEGQGCQSGQKRESAQECRKRDGKTRENDRKRIGLTDAHPARWERSRSEEHTSELQSQSNLVCRLML